jgi:hypothetical protein
MDENVIVWDENFKIVLDQWSEEIKPSSSILTGLLPIQRLFWEKKGSSCKEKFKLLLGGLSSVVVLLIFVGLNEFYDAKY